ncbi:hypothetical protein FOCC_FOCC016267, partial [Frankliniella occidentalis]
MREVRGEESPLCPVRTEEVEAYFKDVFKGRQMDLSAAPDGVVLPKTQLHDGILVAPINREAIAARLSKAANTAPGPDGVDFNTLKSKDRGAHVMFVIFSRCYNAQTIPAAWRTSRTILLHKKGPKDSLSNWRPIALSNCMYKLYTGVLADAILSWSITTGAISKEQKGFMPYEGCSEHNFVLQQCLDDARITNSNLTITWLDLTNAFGSVPHNVIKMMLQQHGLPQHLVDLIMDLYNGWTFFSTSSGDTGPVNMDAGVKQGDPLSPVIFNLVIEILILTLLLLKDTNGYKLFDKSLCCLGYADDLVLLARSKEDMQHLLDAVSSAAQWIGLSFNAKKCATLCLEKKKACPVTTYIQGSAIGHLTEGETYEHLGVPTGLRADQTPNDTIKNMLQDVRAVEKCLLAPWQKLDALRTFVVPQIQFALQTALIHKTTLTEIDRELKRVAKAALHLPQRASPEVVYLPTYEGGANILPLADLADVSAVVHAFRLLTSPDPAVSTIAETSLKRTASKYFNTAAGWEDAATYLSGENPRNTNAFATIWSHARSATKRLTSKIPGLHWSWCAELQTICVEWPTPDREPGRCVIDAESRKSLQHYIRREIQVHYKNTLLSKPDQGKVFEAAQLHQASNHFLRDGRHTRFCDWRFVHRARLGVLPLNGALRIPGRSRTCRRCQYPEETTAHVLCHCHQHSRAWNNRHRSVINNLVENMNTTEHLRVERAVPEANSRLMPDLVVINNERKLAIIVDVACPFD